MFQIQVDSEIALELINSRRASFVFDIISEQNSYLSEWVAWPPHTKSINDYMCFVSDSLHRYADGKGMVCYIIYLSNPVGCIGFNTINENLKKAEIGYWLSQNYQGKGIMTRSVKCLIDMAFNQLGLEKIEIPVSEGNLPSRAVCERLGFKNEGIITNAENLNGRIMDHVYYGLQCKNWNK